MHVQVRKNKMRSLWFKFGVSIISLVLFLIAFGVIFEAIASKQGANKYPPKGKLVDVGDFKLHLETLGEGKPTIILETGSGASSLSWGDLPKELSEYGTVVTYDRGGYAWSEKATTARTGENIVSELYTALKKENIEGPYIIVGHSLGGMYARLFAQTYEDEVAGLILLDARPENYSQETDPILLDEGIDPLLMGSPSKHVLSLLKQSGVIRLFKDSILKDIPEEHRELALNVEFSTKYIHAKEDELRNMKKVEDSIRNQSLGNIPLTVVTHGIPIDGTIIGLSKEADQKMEEIWQDQQEQMLELSSDSKFVIAENSSHSIMLDEPEVIVSAVKEMIGRVK